MKKLVEGAWGKSPNPNLAAVTFVLQRSCRGSSFGLCCLKTVLVIDGRP